MKAELKIFSHVVELVQHSFVAMVIVVNRGIEVDQQYILSQGNICGQYKLKILSALNS